jgi:tetratricopeptide (TPR) repeat protein
MDSHRCHPQVKSSSDLDSSELRPSSQLLADHAKQDIAPLAALTAAPDAILSRAAIDAVRHRQYERALYLLNQLIGRHPDGATYYSNRGILHLWRGYHEAALDDCNQAIELEPTLDQAYNNRGNCYAAMGLSVKALIDYERAVDLNPFNSRARINLGVTFRSLGNFDAALNCFDEALHFYKLLALIYAERGRTYHLRGDWNCALADYRRSVATMQAGQTSRREQRLVVKVSEWTRELLPNHRLY